MSKPKTYALLLTERELSALLNLLTWEEAGCECGFHEALDRISNQVAVTLDGINENR